LKTLNEIIQILKENKTLLNSKYAIEEIGIFGSYLKDEQNENSDLDILISFSKTPSLFRYIEIEECLTKLLGIKIELVMKSALRPHIGKAILNEVKYI